MFLDKHKTQAENEQDCFAYNLNLAIDQYRKGRFEKCAVYLENAAGFAWNLNALHNEKQMTDEAWLLLKQIEGEQVRRYFF